MTAPYTQDAYADWKRRFQENSAVGGLLRYATTEAGITPPPQSRAPAILQPPATPRRVALQPEEEQQFRQWYGQWADRAGIDPDPDNPLHKYDYRAAFRAGAVPEVAPEDGMYHWPSEFKDDDHPNRFVAGFGDTKNPQMPPVLRPTPPFAGESPDEDLHRHKAGILGRLSHLVGADRTDPGVASALTEEEQKQVRPGLLPSLLFRGLSFGLGTPQDIQRARAQRLLGMKDESAGRQRAERQEALSRQIEEIAATMDPKAGVEYAARMKAIYGLPSSTAATQAAVGLKDPAPQRITWTTVPMMVNGKQAMVMRSNDGQLLDASTGADLREQGARMEPIPLSDTFTPMQGETPAGNIPVLGNRSGQVRDSGIAKPDMSDRTQATVRRQVSSNRSQIGVIREALAELEKYPEAVGLTRAAGDAVNQRVDPRGVPVRAAIANIGSLRIHDRSGAAVTAKEFPRLSPFIPLVYDTPEAAKTKLEGLLRELERETEELERGTTTAPPSTPATPPTNRPASGGRTYTDPVTGRTYRIP